MARFHETHLWNRVLLTLRRECPESRSASRVNGVGNMMAHRVQGSPARSQVHPVWCSHRYQTLLKKGAYASAFNIQCPRDLRYGWIIEFQWQDFQTANTWRYSKRDGGFVNEGDAIQSNLNSTDTTSTEQEWLGVDMDRHEIGNWTTTRQLSIKSTTNQFTSHGIRVCTKYILQVTS
jgi:hypothetical protein